MSERLTQHRDYRGHMLVSYPGATLWRASVTNLATPDDDVMLMTPHVFETPDSALDYAAGWLDAKLGKVVGNE